ncbi:MAG: rhomboid family intramembrane serine protease [Clostridiales bacterium]|nr:rhomboid family intramembrane serine protease [Clostridiales bacterium]
MIYRQSWLDKLERRFGKFAIKNLMLIVVGAMAIVYIMNYAIAMSTGNSLSSILIFDRNAIMSGQIWRIFTFLFLPPNSSLLFIVLSLYFYWLIGSSLESQWGSFGFTVYYLLGAIGAIASGLISGYATNSYLNMSLFLAFALLNPNFEVLLFFFFPVKMKWLALIDAAGFIFSFIVESWAGRLSLVMALINVIIFFAPNFIDWIKSLWRRYKWKKNFK